MINQTLPEVKIVDLDEIIDMEGNLNGRFAVRVPEDLLNLWKWIIDSKKSEASLELRKLVLQYCKGQLDSSFNDKFVRESICPNCDNDVGAPWLVPKHVAEQCSYN